MSKERKNNPNFLLGEINAKVDYIKIHVDQLSENIERLNGNIDNNMIRIEKHRGMIEVLNERLEQHLRSHNQLISRIPIVVGIITLLLELFFKFFG